MAANDHDNAPHGDNIISQGETVENRPLASEPVPDPEDIERQSERQAKIAALPNRSIDPKKAVVLAAVACGAIVLGFSTIDAMRSDPTEKAEKAEKPDERQLANYDPKSIIAPTLADAPNDPNAPVPMTEVPALDGSQAPRTAGASGRPQKSEGQVIAEAQRRAGIMAYGGENGGGVGGAGIAAEKSWQDGGDASVNECKVCPRKRQIAGVFGRVRLASRREPVYNRHRMIRRKAVIPCFSSLSRCLT